jgi:hypothetical protein
MESRTFDVVEGPSVASLLTIINKRRIRTGSLCNP